MAVTNSVLRLLGLITSCLAAGVAYSLDVFAIYATDFKAIYKVEQSSVEAAITLGYLGLLSSLPAGVVCRRIGPRWLSFIAGVLSTTGAMLCLTSLHFLDFYQENFTFISFYYFLMGAGGGLMYVIASSVTINNFDSRDLGLKIGLVNGFRSAVPGIFIISYIYAESADFYDSSYRIQRLKHLYIALTAVYFITNIMGVFFYGYYRERPRAQSLTQPGALRRRYETRLTESTALLFKTNIAQKPKKWWSNLIEPEYQLLLWPTIIILGFKTSFVSNISTFATSFHLSRYRYTVIILTILPFVSTFSKPAMGYFSDTWITKLPRSAFLLPVMGLFCVVLTLCLFLFSNVYIQGLSAVTTVLVSGIVQTLIPPLLVALFGRSSFPVVWGFCTVGWSLFTLIFNILLGVFYEMNISDEVDTNTCYGAHCYHYYILITLLLCLSSMALYGVLLRRELTLRIDHSTTLKPNTDNGDELIHSEKQLHRSVTVLQKDND